MDMMINKRVRHFAQFVPGDRVVTPTGRPGIVTARGDFPTVRYTDREGGTVALDASLLVPAARHAPSEDEA